MLRNTQLENRINRHCKPPTYRVILRNEKRNLQPGIILIALKETSEAGINGQVLRQDILKITVLRI